MEQQHRMRSAGELHPSTKRPEPKPLQVHAHGLHDVHLALDPLVGDAEARIGWEVQGAGVHYVLLTWREPHQNACGVVSGLGLGPAAAAARRYGPPMVHHPEAGSISHMSLESLHRQNVESHNQLVIVYVLSILSLRHHVPCIANHGTRLEGFLLRGCASVRIDQLLHLRACPTQGCADTGELPRDGGDARGALAHVFQTRH
mmetsp:Transcript_34439/g.64876  ORF Transcript_34439/g.64876 Transcript_34439/m.64876 type:complete len:202 (-) Transcript_34439:5-610(-)